MSTQPHQLSWAANGVFAVLRCVARMVSASWRELPLLRLFGVPVTLHTSWLLFPGAHFAWLAWSDREEPWFRILCALPVGFVFSLLIHEFAHVLTARWFGIGTRRVMFFPLGCVALCKNEFKGVAEFCIALAGPAASLALALACWLVSQWLRAHLFTRFGLRSDSTDFLATVLWEHRKLFRFLRDCLDLLASLNLYIALFNLIPCYPMDGGRILRSLLRMIFTLFLPRYAGRADWNATRIAVRWVALPLVLVAIVLTIWKTHLWVHFFLFPLVLLAGELELRVLGRRPLPSPKLIVLPHDQPALWQRLLPRPFTLRLNHA